MRRIEFNVRKTPDNTNHYKYFMSDNDFLIILIMGQIAAAMPSVISIVKYKSFTLGLKIFAWHLVFASIIEITGLTLWYLKINNLFLSHIDALEQFIMFSLLYGHLFNEYVKQKWVYIVIIIFTIFAVLNAIYLQPLTTNATNTTLIQSVATIAYIMFALYMRSKKIVPEKFIPLRDYKLDRISFAFINVGILMPCIASIIVYALSNNVLDPKLHSLALKVWGLHAVVSIISNIFICIGLLYFKRPAEEPVVD